MRLALALPLILLAGLARAEDAEEVVADCGGTTVEMNACIWEEYEAADKELNAVWKDVMATFTPAPDYMPAEAARDWKDSLVAAQRAWVTYKEKDCNGAVAYEWYGGTGANGAVGACMLGKTRDRIDDLRERYLNR